MIFARALGLGAILSASPALALDRTPAQRLGPIQSPSITISGPGSTGPIDGMTVTPNPNAPAGTIAQQLLNALPSGRKAVEQGDGSDLFAPPSGSAAAGSLAAAAYTGRISAPYAGIKAGGSASVNSAMLAAQIAAMGAAGGGAIEFPCGVYAFTAIDNNVSGVTLQGHVNQGAHDGGSPTDCVRFQATQPGTLLRHRTPYGASAAQNRGGGFRNITLDANGVATRLLEVDSVGRGTYVGTLLNAVGTEAAWFHSGVTGTDVAEAADIQGATIDLQCRQIDGTAAQAASCYRLSGSANANFSLNIDVRLKCQYYNGNCLNGEDADNNSISLAGYRVPGGTGKLLDAKVAFRTNFFTHYSGNAPSYLEGTENGASAGTSNSIFFLDTDNATPVPTAGPGSAWYGDFRQSYPVVITCAGTASSGQTISAGFVRRKSKEISLYFDIGFPSACNGTVSFSLPAPADPVVSAVGMATNRANGSVYALQIAPGTASSPGMPLLSIPGGTLVSLTSGAVIAGSIRYLAAY